MDDMCLSAARLSERSGGRGVLSVLFAANTTLSDHLSSHSVLSPSHGLEVLETSVRLPSLSGLLCFAISAAARGSALLHCADDQGLRQESPFECPAWSNPSISIAEYIERFTTYVPGCEEAFVLALVYVDWLCGSGEVGGLLLTPRTAHRVWAACFVLASKFIDDCFRSSSWYARVAGISTTELNALEVEMLRRLRFSLAASEDEWDVYHGHVRALAAACAACATCGHAEADVESTVLAALDNDTRSCSPGPSKGPLGL